jgi:hypothetical protein
LQEKGLIWQRFVDVPDESLVAKLKQICKMRQGVTSVKVARPSSHTKDITKTAGYREVMEEDIKEGRVYKAASRTTCSSKF